MAKTRKLATELLRQLGVVALVPLVVTMAFFIWQLYPQLKQNIIDEHRSIAALVSKQVITRLKSAEEQVALLVGLEGKGFPLDQITQEFLGENTDFDTIYVLNPEGIISDIEVRGERSSDTLQLYQNLDMSQSIIYHDQDVNRDSGWTKVFLSVVTGRLSTAYFRSLGNERLVAELAIDRLPELSQALAELGTLAMLLDGQKQLIAHPDPSLSQQQMNLKRLGIFSAPSDSESHAGAFWWQNEAYFGTYVQISELGWGVIVAEKEKAIRDQMDAVLRNWFISIALIISLALVMSLGRSRDLSKRFDVLNQQAKDFSRGIYRSSVVDPGIREFKELSENLVIMADAISKREASLHTKERQLSNLLESAPDVAVQWYDKNGTVQYWNKASEQIFGYTSNEAKGKLLEKLVLPASDERIFHDALLSVVSKKERSARLELSYRSKSGSVGQVLGTVFRIPGQLGDDMFACMFTDVTSQRLAEAEIHNMNVVLEHRVEERTKKLSKTNEELQNTVAALNSTMEQLVQSEKLASLGSLVAGVAHELNTPIGNASMASSTLHDFASEIQRKLGDGTITKSDLERFLQDALQATGITSRNLNKAAELIVSFKQVAADQSSSQRRRFTVSDLLHEILVTLHPQTKRKSIEIVLKVDEGIELDSYPGPLGQVVSNLIMNAFVHGFEEQAQGVIEISAFAQGEWVTLTINDNGKGIPSDEQGKIFDPFYTTKLGKGGSGLGLHICHNIVVEVLGGQIKVESSLGDGARFELSLPLTAPHGK